MASRTFLKIGDDIRIRSLDGLRGLACLIVIIHHYYLLPFHEDPNSFRNIWQKILFQTYGVIDIFFALSGWLIGNILLNNKMSVNFYKTFYFRRAARVLPLYFLIVLVYILISKTAETNYPWLFNDPLIPLWTYIFLLQTVFGGFFGTLGDRFIYATWSLALEFHFYIVAPFIIRFFNKKSMVLLYIFLVALAIYLRFLIPGEGNIWMRTLLIWRPEAVFGGLLLSYFTNDGTIIKFKWHLWLLFLVLVPGIILCAFDFYMGPFIYTWFSFVALIFLAALLVVPGFVGRILEIKPFIVLGKYSYSLYLWHLPVLGLIFQLMYHRAPNPHEPDGLIPGLFSIVITLIIGALSYTFIEKPFLKLGKKYSYKA